MRFVSFSEAAEYIRGKSVAVVGSAPSVLDNSPGMIDSHDVVVRANNYKTGPAAGHRCDVHYSFYGTSIRKTRDELAGDGVKLCMNKCPDSKPIECEWHERMGKQIGIDFRYIYEYRKAFWFCDTFVPDDARFLRSFELLGRHIPSTGFAAILDVLDCEPSSVYLTGFDFFGSGLHNVNERWKPGNPADPIGHSPAREAAALVKLAQQRVLALDARLAEIVQQRLAA